MPRSWAHGPYVNATAVALGIRAVSDRDAAAGRVLSGTQQQVRQESLAMVPPRAAALVGEKVRRCRLFAPCHRGR